MKRTFRTCLGLVAIALYVGEPSSSRRELQAQSAGLVAAYGFEEATGTSVTDASGNGNVGTMSTGTTRVAAGRFGAALQFDGTTSGVTIPDSSSLDLTTAMTLEAWVRPTVALSNWRAVVGKDVDQYYLMASSNANVPVVGATFSAGGNVNTYAASGIAINTWTHLAATFDGSAVRLYVNGAQVATQSQSGELTTSNAVLTIGHNVYGERFTGLIDEIRIYNRALTPGEIQTDMGAPVAGAPGAVMTIAQPGAGETITGSTVMVSYSASGDLTGVDHAHFRLDSLPEVMDTDFDGSYQFTGVSAGPHVLRGFLVRADHSPIGTEAVVNFSTTIPDTTPPGAPGTLTAAATGTQIDLSWGAATDNVGVTGYRLERCQGAACTSFAQIATPAGLTYTDSGLTAATSYSYRVRAADAASLLGPYSNSASATTDSTPPPPPPPVGGLVVAYGFEAGTGTTVTDVSGNNNVGTLAAGTTWSTAGRFGNALQFDGTTSGVTVPNAPSLDLTTALTLEAWVYPTVTPSGWRGVIGKDVDRYYLMASSGNNTPVVGGTLTVGGNTNVSAPAGLAVGTWTHLAATFDGTALRLYANGVEVASQSQTGAFTTSNGVFTLGHNVYGERFTGLIDEVRVYNRALSVAEIQSDMGTPVGTPGPRIAITQPAEGAVVASTTVSVGYATSGDLQGVDHVHFQLDSLPEVMDLTVDGAYEFTSVATGPHTIRAYLVRDDHSKIPGTDAAPVNFSSTVPDTIPPAVTLTAPLDGSGISGVVTLAATATDAAGVVGVQFKIDGADAGPEDLTFPYSTSLNTAGYINGQHLLTAVARDVGGNTTTSASITVTISNTNPNDPATVGQWAAAFDWPIVGLHAALLPTGKILSWTNYTDGGGVQLWNPANNSFAGIPYTPANLFCAGQTFLADGRLLVTGGHLGTFVGINNTTIFDSWTEQWITATPMSYARWYPTSTTLPDGRVLTVSGAIDCPNCAIPGDPHDGLADIGEIYNPATNTHTELTSAPKRLEMYPHMFVLPDGRILASSTNEDPIRATVLDLNTNSWADVPGGIVDGGSAAMYAPGKVMKSGSAWNPDYPVRAAAATTYVLDMTSPSPSWRQTPSMAFARTEHNLTLLPDGTVLATGGSRDSNVFDLAPAVYEAELWSPATETWQALSRMSVPRLYHSIALLLPDARVITFGSGTFGIDQLTAQVFSPPYLFKGPRPVITSAPAATSYGNTFTVQTPDGARIASVALMGLGSVTHAFNASQRYLPLTFQQSAGGVDVTMPANPNLAPPGYYMLFLLDTNGVPSVAPMIKVTTVSDTVAPSAPGTLTALASGTQIALTWGPATDNVGVSGYRLERCQGPACANFVEIATPTGTSFINTGLTPATSYTYRVRAVDSAGLLGPYSNIESATTPDTTPPSAPGTLAAVATGTQIALTWGSASDNVAVTGYRIERCLGATCTTFTEVATPAGTSYTDVGLTEGATYRYRARATDAAGLLGPYSNVASATIVDSEPPSAPGTLSATGGAGQVLLSWGAATDNVGITGYRLERCQNAGCTSFAQIATPSGTSYTDIGLSPATSYSYRVRATDAAGLLGGYSNEASATTFETADTTPPGAPGPLTASVGAAQVVLAWGAATDNVGVTGYRLERCVGTGCTGFVEIAATTGTGYTDSSLAAATNYSYRVRATDAAGLLGPYSNVVSATTPDTVVPSAPGTLTATASETEIALSWGPASDNVGVTGYRVERCQGAGCTTFAQIAAPAGLTLTDSGLSAATSYSYRVRAADAAGLLGPYSNVASATTSASPPPGGLVAAFGFEEQTGTTVTDTSGNGNAGTMSTGTTRNAAGRFGAALQFDGTTSGVTVPDAPSLDLTTALTLEAWVYPTVAPSGWRGLIGKDVDRYYLMASSGNDTPAVGGTLTVGDNTNVFAPSALATNTWTHLAATFDGAALRLYVNGVQVATQAQTGAFTTSNAVFTLGYNVYGERFIGLIDEVRVYNRALSVAEIQSDMAAPVGTIGPRLYITQPVEGMQITGPTVAVSYTTSGDPTGVDHVHFQLDSLPQVMDRPLDGSYQFTDVSAGPHTLRGYLVRDDHSKITGTDATPVNFSIVLPDTTPPSAPGVLSAVASTGQIALNWGPATDNVAVTGYRVERCQGTGCTNFTQVGTPTGLTFTDTGLAAATTYSYQVRATDAAGLLGLYSNVASATTPVVTDTTPPSAPGTMAATPSGTQITLNWGAATDNVGVTGYSLERCTGSGCSNFGEIATPPGLTHTDTGLAPATSYSYRVRATDAVALLGAYSNVASATTDAPPPPLGGLVASYGFEEASGTSVLDLSGSNNTGSMLAGATRTSSGRFGAALLFSGSNSGVTVPDSPSLDLTSAMTLEAWVFPTVAPSNWRAVVGKDVDRYYLMASSNGNVPAVGGTFSVGGNTNLYSAGALPVDTWTHLAATFDGATLRLYVNGVLAASQTQTGVVTTSNAILTIGHNVYGERFIGRIDEVRIYNRALTVGEIQTDMVTAVQQ